MKTTTPSGICSICGKELSECKGHKNYMGTVLKEIREENNMTHKDFARILLVGTEDIESLENGTEAPTLEQIEKIGQALGIHPLNIIGRALNKSPMVNGEGNHSTDPLFLLKKSLEYPSAKN